MIKVVNTLKVKNKFFYRPITFRKAIAMLNFNPPNSSNSLVGRPFVESFVNASEQIVNTVPVLEALSDQGALFPESDDTVEFLGTEDFDFLTGEESNDRLYGVAGDDFLFGWEGNDILIDRDGGDLMLGGEGADRFWIDSRNTILDFEVGKDIIGISRSDLSFDSLTFEDSIWATTVYGNGEPLAILAGVDKDSLTDQSFIFDDTGFANQL